MEQLIDSWPFNTLPRVVQNGSCEWMRGSCWIEGNFPLEAIPSRKDIEEETWSRGHSKWSYVKKSPVLNAEPNSRNWISPKSKSALRVTFNSTAVNS
ncbi:unnamed protein product [Acanthocheilonema viteae]|uniref:Uncharacterized protein n=1 Tax=Acanthocheilonema viteae TaxID=6277 RepID=A0A498S4S7_ACAVI|nr:unnamed protein product [Acanthocheilonema viteae]